MLIYVFSYDRPLQLEACLRTFRQFSTKDRRIVVNCATSQAAIKDLYLAHACQDTTYFVDRMELNVEVKAAIEKEEFVMFLHDDLIFYKAFNPDDFMSLLTQTDSYVSAPLHLGNNITHLRDMLVPPHDLREQARPADPQQEAENVLSWSWLPLQYSDFYYPIPLCSTVYRTELLLQRWNCVPLDCSTPNQIEISLTNHPWPLRMLSYNQSVCYQIMDNQICKDRGILDIRIEQFERGCRIDTEALNGSVGIPKACAFVHPMPLRGA